MKTFSHAVTWDPHVASYFGAALGPARLAAISEALARPSLRTTLRVNTLRTTPAAVVDQLKQQLGTAAAAAAPHPVVPSAVVLPGTGPLQPDYEGLCGGREIVVNRYAAEAVLKGADVFSPGLMAISPGVSEDNLVAVTCVLETKQGRAPLSRGLILREGVKAPSRDNLHVGIGRAVGSRSALFKSNEGLAIKMVQRVFDIPACNGLLVGDAMLQALPCIVAAHALNPAPGSRVLDMCASPGGKTTMLAQLMDDKGSIIAIDRTAAKAAAVASLASDMGITCIDARVADSTQFAPPPLGEPSGSGNSSSSGGSGSGENGGSSSSSSSISGSSSGDGEGRGAAAAAAEEAEVAPWAPPAVLADLQPESFDYVLLDAPCSALGLRPRLLHSDWKLKQLNSTAGLQRALMHSAMRMLKPGGVLVYCTCTINPGENEGNVRFALDRWHGALQLEQQPLVLGGPGLEGPGLLDTREAPLVQRFDPGAGPNDTIGFFIARFRKTASTV